MSSDQRNDARRAQFRDALIFCVVCIFLNVAGALLAQTLNLPIYLDSLGTILASITGGFVPGIVVGYLSNFLTEFFYSTNIYYGIVSVLIAIVTSILAQRGWFKKLPNTLLAVVLLSLVSGATGSLLHFFLHGQSLGSDIAAPFAQQLHALGLLDLMSAQVLAALLVDYIDKSVVVLLATLIYHMLSEDYLHRLDFALWQQAPLTRKQLKEAMDTQPRRMSLRTKMILLVAPIMGIVALVTGVFSWLTFHQSMLDTEATKARGITSLMANVVDPDMIDEYLEDGESAPGYLKTEAQLADIRDSFNNVRYVYVYQIQSDGCHVVLDPDNADEAGSDPGTIIPFDDAFMELVPTLLAGGEIDPIVSNETYGWLLTIYTPLKNATGTTVCYLAADISMDHLVSDEMSFIAGICSLFAAFFILVCAIVLWLARFSIIVPVNSISRAANGFMIGNEGFRTDSLAAIQALDIRTGDEIENLYDAVSQLSQEAVNYIAEAQEKSDTISRMQSNLIMVMADLVESRDKFTGDHVRNTALYARIIMNQMRREGICADVLTNEFINNVFQSAPLHDIGKIVVSDTILNKPGRLTDEEFKIMQSHTLAGQQILEDAKGAVSESSYLDEAQRLAAYHHEKWNGTGYPYGLKGEEIPLSARIMAVADVFDALVSKRSYKAGFPVEKAFAIIEDGIGTHFDPQVARAFLHAQDRVRAVVKKTEEKKRLEEEAAARRAEEAGESPAQPADAS